MLLTSAYDAAILKRDWTEITGEATRSLLNATRTLCPVWIMIEDDDYGKSIFC